MRSLRRSKHSLTRTRVLVARSALAAMEREADARRPLETGGMLLGYIAPKEGVETVVIEVVLGPGPEAVHSTHCFEPDDDWQQRELAEAYATSGRVTTYLGDWHTHPSGTTTPSRRDLRTARSIARTRGARAPRPLMMILAPGSDGWNAASFRYERGALVEVAAQVLDAT